jgi:hypothetical protein
MKRRGAILAVILLVTSLADAAYGWDDFGHMTVAYVCYQKLKPEVKARVNALTRLNPMYHQWEQQVSETSLQADKGAQIFMLAATWPDMIKGGHGYSADGLSNGNRPAGPEASQNAGYSDLLMHKYWHYCDHPYTQDGSPLPAVPTPNAQTQIDQFREVLNSDASDSLKSYDLCWLLHLVGDIHQPLHCITRVSKADPDGDNGGNNVRITGSDQELHAFWDNALGQELSPAKVPEIANHLKKSKKKLASKLDVNRWVQESFDLAIHKVYGRPIGPSDGPFTLTKKYEQMTQKICRKRVELAGERLANVLNGELK